MKTIPTVIIAGLLFVLSASASVFGWRREYFSRQLEKYGEETQAMVTSSTPSRAGAAHSPAHLGYTFSYSNKTYEGGRFISDEVEKRIKPGDVVRIRFLPNRPETNKPAELPEITFYQITHLGLIAATAISFFYIFFWIAVALKF